MRAVRRRPARLRAVQSLRHRFAFECQQPVPARVSPKDAPNTCTFYEPRTTVERETKTVAPTSARKAFDDLFK